MDNGFWTKFEVRQIVPTIEIPHGIRYSLTLHDVHNRRVFGIDNAHAFKPKKKKYGAKIHTWDHKHKLKVVLNYEFESAAQLVLDFWLGVDEVIEELLK